MTNISKIYKIDQALVVKMPIREDDYTNLLLKIIYERQIKRMINYFLYINQGIISNQSQNLDFFVLSASDPTELLNYASISQMNNTLDTIWDPINLEFWILITLNYLAFFHRILHLVNLDIKP